MPFCNYCGRNESSLITEYTRFEKNKVLKCKSCELVYLELGKSRREVESFYATEYRKRSAMRVLSAEEHYYDKVIQQDARNRILFVGNCLDIRDKRVLEIGSASGRMLETLMEYGAKEAVGVELNEEFAAYTRERGFKVYDQPMEELNLREEFDVIVSFFTLEHVYDPMVVFNSVWNALKQGGSFLGEVPNQDDWRIKIFDNEVVKRLHYDPNHYFYFSPVTFRNYLETNAFENIRFETAERYNSLIQLKNILCVQNPATEEVDDILTRFILPEKDEDDVRLQHVDDLKECMFNRVFERGVNSELMGNCLRFFASRSEA